MSFTKIPISLQMFVEEVDDLVDVVRLLEHDEVLLSATRSFHSFLYTFMAIISLEFVLSNLRLTVSEDVLSLSIQESPNLFDFRVLSLNFLSVRHLCHGKQQVSPFYHDSLTTTTDRMTSLLLQSDRLVFGTHEGASDRW